MSLSQATLVNRVRLEQRDFPWETTGSAASASSAVAVTDGTDWAEGDIGEFQNDGEVFYVKSVAVNDLTCTRGYYGTTAVTQASGRVIKRPRHFYTEITNAISSVIQVRLYPRAYKKVADTITPPTTNQTTTWNDLAADALGIIRVTQAGTVATNLNFYGTRHGLFPVTFARNLPTAIAASGVGLLFPNGFYHGTNAVNVDYSAKITDTVAALNYSDLADGDAVTEAIIFGAVSHLEGSMENSKPRKPRADRETLRGAALYDRKFEEALARAEMELRDTIPINSYAWVQ